MVNIRKYATIVGRKYLPCNPNITPSFLNSENSEYTIPIWKIIIKNSKNKYVFFISFCKDSLLTKWIKKETSPIVIIARIDV